ncbi:MAG: hypothetical protein KF847_04075 [Pirellulales bacterium]|nr:hypothetical protein [Pirellulales bacterium]
MIRLLESPSLAHRRQRIPHTTARFAAASAGVYGLALIGLLALAGRTADRSAAQQPAPAARYGDATDDAKRSATANRRIREGSVIQNVIGVFRRNGDTASFIAEDGMEFGGLPNLNLERVVKLLKSVEEPESVYWSVNGEVTEFSGRNYLLIQRAVFKAAAPPPTPQAIAE